MQEQESKAKLSLIDIVYQIGIFMGATSGVLIPEEVHNHFAKNFSERYSPEVLTSIIEELTS